MEDVGQILVVVNLGTLVAVVTFGYRIIRFLNRIEFRTEVLWRDYERRMALDD